MSLKIGSLFSGYGGLDLATEAFFGAETAWHVEFDKAPSKILAHRWPGVPNHGDVTTTDWAAVEPVDILTGGFPCQDLSGAGRRQGMRPGTRSGLWSDYVKAIDALRPGVVVVENVRGLLSGCAESDLGPCEGCVGDGEHQPPLRALGRVLGDLADLGFDAEWAGIRASDVGAPHGRFRVFVLAYSRRVLGSGRFAAAGEATRGRASAVTAGRDRAPVNEDDLLLPTPVASPSGNTPENHLRKKPGRSVVTDLAILLENGLLATGGQLLPTPSAMNPNEEEDLEKWEERRARVKLDKGNGNGFGTPLGVAVRMMPTPRAPRGGSATELMYGFGAERDDDGDAQGNVVLADAIASDWGQYEGAVRRWEAVTRPAPEPTLPDGKNGQHRLNAAFAEWMMGLPAGWITDPAIGISRREQLKACGNGVVPQQAHAALDGLWSRVLEAVPHGEG